MSHNLPEVDREQFERYQRQILVPQVGHEGQALLRKKRVMVVGAGGLGTPCLAYLAGMGVGQITILDRDTVSLSNLPRQTLYEVDDIGKPKAPVMAEKLLKRNPGITVTPLTEPLSEQNALDMVSQHDVVVSCVDNPETRYILNKAAVNSGTPLVEGAVMGFQGLCTVIMPGEGPCYQCLFPRSPVTARTPLGVVGPAPGVIGSIQASEVLKILLNKGEPLVGRLLLVDLLSCEFRMIAVKRNPNCPVCGGIRPKPVRGS